MADTTIKLSGTYDSIEAYRILEEMREMGADFEDIKTEAKTAASTATAAVATAQIMANNASTYETNAQTYAGNANTSAGEAAGYASNASTSANNAATSEINASNSASAAATFATNAAASASSAAASEAVVNGALPLSGGTLTGSVKFNGAGVTPINIIDTGTEYRDIQVEHTDGKRVGIIRFARNASSNSVTIGASDGKNSAPGGITVERTLGDGSTAGTVTATAPTPAQTDDSTKIATTAYVKDCVPKSVGDSNIPVYVDANGVVTSTGKSFANYAPVSKSVGGTQRPVYTDANGKATACTETGKNGGLEGVTTVASNYIRYVSGLQICWGETEIQTSGTTISFGAAFTAAPKIVAELQADGQSTTAWLTKIVSKSTTNFKMYVTNNSAFQQKSAMWIAIGKWK